MIIQSQDLMMTGERKYSKTMTVATASTYKPIANFRELTDAMTKQAQNGKVEKVDETQGQKEAEAPVKLKFQVLNYLLRMIFMNRGRRPWGEEWEQKFPQEMLGRGIGLGVQQVTTENFYSYQEMESTTFATEGKVVTSDGREISFGVEFSMSQSFEEMYYEKNVGVESMMCDPLVINMDIDTAQVSDQKFYFDLDCDGEEEALSMLSAGSGFLALDLNNDGIIGDGSELFGTKSGNGFYDLSKYDLDGNGWIDEADEIFDKLQIWVPSADGKGTCYKLKEKDIGAICLQNVSTDFTLRGEEQQINAAIRRSGVFLFESGRAGTIQHVDMAM